MFDFKKDNRGRYERPLRLTDKQKQLLIMSAQGYKYKDITRIMKMKHTTLSSHFRHLMERWNVRTRAALIVKAISKGHIDLNSIDILTR